MKRNGNAERPWRENRGAEGAERGGVWEGLSPSPVGEGSGEVAVPRPQKFLFDFLSGIGTFWCILCACFNVSIRRVKQSRKAVLCVNCQLVSYLTWRTYHPWYHIHKHIYQSQQSASQTHMQLILWTLYRHTRTYRLSIYSMHFIKDHITFCWWHVYFYEHVSGVWFLIKFRWSTTDVTKILFKWL